MLQRRELAVQLNEELGFTIPEFQTAARLSESPTAVGQRLREALGVAIERQLRWRDEWQAWREWRSAVEQAGVLVFQFPKVRLEQTRGVSLLDFPLPAVGINSKESSPGARIYSLLHELVHIALALRIVEIRVLSTRNAFAFGGLNFREGSLCQLHDPS